MVRSEKEEERPVLAFRLAPEEKAEVERLAKQLDSSLSTAARIILRRGLQAPPTISV